jgi:hypothetical protein
MPTIKDLMDKVFEVSPEEIKWFPVSFHGQGFAATNRTHHHRMPIVVPEDIPFEKLGFGDLRLIAIVVSEDILTRAIAELKEERKDLLPASGEGSIAQEAK